MKNLGKILLILFLGHSYIYASVVASVDSSSVELGEIVTLNINLDGKDIKKPDIFTLCGENIISTSSRTSVEYINGNYKKKYILSYRFIPTSTCTIEPIDIYINGVLEKTLPVQIKVEKAVRNKYSKFYLEIKSDKKEVYVGESFEVTVIFKQKKSEKVIDNKFTAPSFKGFWVKGEPTQRIEDDGDYSVSKIIYTLAPQRVGSLNISAANIKLASRQNRTNYWGGLFSDVTWKTYFSNDLEIFSKPLPSGIDLVGEFVLEAYVDKMEVNPNEAVNLSITMTGEGNLEDVISFKPYIDGVSVFDEKIAINKNVLTQKITFVGDNTFIIPSFMLKVFNPQTQKMKIIATQPIEIQINNTKQTGVLEIKREVIIPKPVIIETTQEFNKLWLLLAFIIGVILGVLIMILKPFISWERKKKLDVKDTKKLLVKLMPYKEDKEVEEIVNTLENNLYSNEEKTIPTKVLKKIIKKYAIS